MKKIIILTFFLVLFLLPIQSFAITLYVPYEGMALNATGEIWCIRQDTFQLSTGEGVAEYDRGLDKCIATLILDSHREPAEITSVDVAIKSLESKYVSSIEKLEKSINMKTFWIWFILIFGGMINIMFFTTTVMLIHIYPNLRFR